jgi:small-conductance mechanosensitive channel
VTVALFAIAIILILDNLGVNVTGLVAGLGIGGIAIGLARRASSRTCSRRWRSSSTALPARRHHHLRSDHRHRRADRPQEHPRPLIGRRGGRHLQRQSPQHAHPELGDDRAAALGDAAERRLPDAAELLASLPDEIKTVVEAQALATFDRCHIAAFAPSSIDIELVFHVEVGDYPLFMQTKQQVMLGILRRFAELGVSFAYPTQTTFTAAPDGTLIMPYATHIHADAGGSQADIVQR